MTNLTSQKLPNKVEDENENVLIDNEIINNQNVVEDEEKVTQGKKKLQIKLPEILSNQMFSAGLHEMSPYQSDEKVYNFMNSTMQKKNIKKGGT